MVRGSLLVLVALAHASDPERQWLEENAQRPGVITHESGLQRNDFCSNVPTMFSVASVIAAAYSPTSIPYAALRNHAVFTSSGAGVDGADGDDEEVRRRQYLLDRDEKQALKQRLMDWDITSGRVLQSTRHFGTNTQKKYSKIHILHVGTSLERIFMT